MNKLMTSENVYYVHISPEFSHILSLKLWKIQNPGNRVLGLKNPQPVQMEKTQVLNQTQVPGPNH